MSEFIVSIFLSTLRVSTPLVFASMGGLMSERAGVVNIALEGFMIVGAFSAACVASYTHSPLMGALAAFIVGVIFAAIYALSVIAFRADQIVAGTAINLLALGAVPLASKAIFDSTGSTPALDVGSRFQSEPLFAAILLVILIHFWIQKTRSGLWHGFAGEHPEALSTAGIRVRAVRVWSVLMGGGLAALGGATLSIYLSSSYSRGMSAGRGFMALAALIFGKWRPIPTLLACLFFGFTDAVQIRLQGVKIWGDAPIPVQFIQILPYAITIFVLAGFVGKSRAPAKLGVPWMVIAALSLGAFSGCVPVDFLRGRATSPSPVAVPPLSLAEGNVVLLREMFQVVLLVKNPEPEILQPSAMAILQGASLEGIYNGLIASRQYRQAENDGMASPRAVSAFSEVLADLQVRLQKPFALNSHSPQPPASIQRPTGISVGEKSAPVAEPEAWREYETILARRDRKSLTSFYSTVFARSSFFTLKRVLGEATLYAFTDGIDPKPELYADLALSWNARLLNLTPEHRKSLDRSFHLNWAKQAPMDRMIWEALNRVHRILDESIVEVPAARR